MIKSYHQIHQIPTGHIEPKTTVPAYLVDLGGRANYALCFQAVSYSGGRLQPGHGG